MIQCMEAWFITDKDSPKYCFGIELNTRNLSQEPGIEKIAKGGPCDALKRASYS